MAEQPNTAGIVRIECCTALQQRNGGIGVVVGHRQTAQGPEEQWVFVIDLFSLLQRTLGKVVLPQVNVSEAREQQGAEFSGANLQSFPEFANSRLALVLPVAGQTEVDPRSQNLRISGEDLPIELFCTTVVLFREMPPALGGIVPRMMQIDS